MHDGSLLRLRKLHTDYSPTDRSAAMKYLHDHRLQGEVVTGLLYVETGAPDFADGMHLAERPLNNMGKAELCPGQAELETINRGFR